MPKHHYRCHICGRDFDRFEPWRNHVETRHADGNQKWWLVVEDPSDLPFEAQEP
ncbi:hypothetical protein ACFQGE_11100 [Halomicroarcula sp. GCM10025817]|uniref:hypothetical protein n=1 Tax=Haloarcula TaxID=2237 RepID=UPI0023E8A026|nr:hypothetical protein [Halomicroarcula sp. SYNS111]